MKITRKSSYSSCLSFHRAACNVKCVRQTRSTRLYRSVNNGRMRSMPLADPISFTDKWLEINSAAIARLSDGGKWPRERIRQSVGGSWMASTRRSPLPVRSHLPGHLFYPDINPLRHRRKCAASRRRNIKRNTLNIKQRDTDLGHLRRCQRLIGALGSKTVRFCSFGRRSFHEKEAQLPPPSPIHPSSFLPAILSSCFLIRRETRSYREFRRVS